MVINKNDNANNDCCYGDSNGNHTYDFNNDKYQWFNKEKV